MPKRANAVALCLSCWVISCSSEIGTPTGADTDVGGDDDEVEVEPLPDEESDPETATEETEQDSDSSPEESESDDDESDGEDGDAGVMSPPQVGSEVTCADEVEPGPAPLRRLSRVEYGNTVFQLFGDPNDQRLGVAQLVPDGEALGFSNQASVVSTSPLLASQYLSNAEVLAERHAGRFESELSACADDATASDCLEQVEAWVAAFGQKVYRRPLSEEEVADFVDIYDWEVSARGEYQEGVKLVLHTLLQSPHFLYRAEFGSGEEVADGVAALSSWEMASRLSYLFWNTMPDIGLFEAAAADELRTPAQIEKQARRLVNAQRSRLAFRNFHDEWLDLPEILNVRHNGRDTELFPDYSDAVPPELYEETLEFFDHAIFEEQANLEYLLTAPVTRLNQHSAAFYGIDGPTSDEFETVELDPERYSGFLTQAGLLMAHSTTELGSPIHRGLFVRTALLCQPPPPPPPDVPPPPTIDRTKTTREQYAEHSENAACAGCHVMMDSIGLAFEHFDAMGRYRETEWGQTIDASGVVYQLDEDGNWFEELEFDGVAELARELAASERVKQCVARQWFRFSMGRSETGEDGCSLQQLDEQFAAADYDIRELLVALTQTPAFRYMRHSSGGAGGNP